MCARQVAGAHQELADDLAAGEQEGLLEQPDPVGVRQRMVRVDPALEAAELGAQIDDAPRVLDRRVDLQAVADDAGVGEQPRAVGLVEGGDGVDVGPSATGGRPG